MSQKNELIIDLIDLFQAFSSFSRLLPHSCKQHAGAPKPVPLYLPGRSPSPLLKDESNEDENEGEDDEQKISHQNISSLISHSSTSTMPTPNFFNLMNNWMPSSSASLNPGLLSMSSSVPSTSKIINFSHGNDDISSMTSMISSTATSPKVYTIDITVPIIKY